MGSVSSSVNQGMGGDGPEVPTCSELRWSRGGVWEGDRRRIEKNTRKKGEKRGGWGQKGGEASHDKVSITRSSEVESEL